MPQLRCGSTVLSGIEKTDQARAGRWFRTAALTRNDRDGSWGDVEIETDRNQLMNATILNVSQNYFVRGGSDRYFFGLAELLERHGQRVIPFCSKQPKNLTTAWERYFPPGVDFDKPGVGDLLRYVYSRSAAKAIENLLRDETIDL